MSRRTASSSPVRVLNTLFAALVAAVNRLDKSLDPRDTVAKLKRHELTFSDSIYVFHSSELDNGNQSLANWTASMLR